MDESVTDFIARKTERLHAVLEEFYEAEGEPVAALLRDILSDLRHLAHEHDEDFEAALRVSELHYECERDDMREEAGMT